MVVLFYLVDFISKMHLVLFFCFFVLHFTDVCYSRSASMHENANICYTGT
jgi:hypothetical protein